MTNAGAKNLTGQKLRQLFSALKGDNVTTEAIQVQATEYDWHVPHHFNRDQFKKLGRFADKMAETINKPLGLLCRGDIKVKIVSTTEHFANEIFNELFELQRKHHGLAFSDAQNNPSGFVYVSAKEAAKWAAQLLGDAEDQEQEEIEKDLSQLEKSLLVDIACAVIDGLSDASKSNSGPALQRTGDMLQGKCPVVLSPTEELCKITFQVEQLERTAQASVIILSSVLEPVVGMQLRAGSKVSPEETSRKLIENLNRVPVRVTAQLGSCWPTLADIMNLQVADILLLDRKVDEPVEVYAEGEKLFCGWPARSLGKYVVVITGSQKD